MSGLALFVGLSDMIGGYDRYIYGEHFDSIADNIRTYGINATLYELAFVYKTEQGFAFLNLLISFFTRNRYLFVFIVTLIVYLLLYSSFKKYCKNCYYSVLLFLGMWFFFTFTYLRQVLAVAICWSAIPFVVNRKFFKFLIVCLLAFSFHNSAIVFFPIYFIHKKLQIRYVLLMCFVAFSLGLSGIVGSIFSYYGQLTGFEERNGIYQLAANIRFDYIIESCLFLFILVKNCSKISSCKDDIICLNMAFIFCAVLLLFCRYGNGGRLSWFFMFGIISIVPSFADKKHITSYNLFVIILAFALYLRILVAWGGLLSPYKTFLTPGYRTDDPIRPIYEYDSKYEKDKFYR